MRFTLVVVTLVTAVGAVRAEQPTLQRDPLSLVDARHAFHFYTAALAEKDDAARLNLLTRAIELNPNFYRASFSRGVLHAKGEARAEAEADFVKAIEIYPEFMTAHYNLACLRAKGDQNDAALASLETALKSGYRRFDKVRQDADLTSIAKSDEFLNLVSKYEASAKATAETPLQKLQTLAPADRAKLVLAEKEKPTAWAEAIAGWAMYESDVPTRVLAMQLWPKADKEPARQRLATGLYDANVEVCKAAANALISYGKPIAETIRPVLADQDMGASFYAMQIASRVDARECSPEITLYLKHDDPKTRMMAAQCLAELQSQDALPEIQAALENAPVDQKAREAYRATMERAIQALSQ